MCIDTGSTELPIGVNRHEIHSNTYDRYIQIHMLDALSRHTVKSGLTRGIVYLLRIQCGINVFLRKSSAAWYRLAKYIMTQE